MKKVISTAGYGTAQGHTAQITLPNGKYYYVGVNSIRHSFAMKQGWECKVVEFFGACIYININDRAHKNFPIQIDDVSVADFLDKIATEKEADEFIA